MAEPLDITVDHKPLALSQSQLPGLLGCPGSCGYLAVSERVKKGARLTVKAGCQRASFSPLSVAGTMAVSPVPNRAVGQHYLCTVATDFYRAFSELQARPAVHSYMYAHLIAIYYLLN